MNKTVRAPRRMTARYSGMQASYWVIHCALFSYATVFLQARDFRASQIGVILSVATILSGLIQPIVAAFADRTQKVSIRTMIAFFGAAGLGVLLLLFFLHGAQLIFGLVFLVAALLIDMIQPLMNALSVYYSDRNIPVNFGIGRGLGSMGFMIASVALGYAIRYAGSDAMLAVSAVAYVIFIVIAMGFPVLRGVQAQPACAAAQESSTLWQFFRKYRVYCISLTGVLFLSCFHLMNENYLIRVMERLGGTASDMGVSLAISTAAEIPVIMFFYKIRHRAKTGTWLKIAAVAFLLKSICYYLAPSVTAVHLTQLLQLLSYGIYAPAAVLYASEQIAPHDMVKGQAMIAAFYTFGGSLGNFVGGFLIDRFGVTTMMASGILSAALSVVILFATIRPPRTVQ